MEHPKHDDSDLFDERYDEEGIRYLAEAMAHNICKEDLIIYATDGLKHSLEDDYGFFKESWTKYMED